MASPDSVLTSQSNSIRRSEYADRPRSSGIISRYAMNPSYGTLSPSTPNSLHASLFPPTNGSNNHTDIPASNHEARFPNSEQLARLPSYPPREHVIHSLSKLKLCSEDCLCEKDGHAPPFRWSELIAFSGVSWITSVAFVDPGNLEVDFQYGIMYQYRLVWVLLLTTAMAIILQVLSARLGVVTGKHLAEHCRDQYSHKMRMVLFAVSQLGIVAFDVAEVIGTAIALQILFQISLPIGMMISVLDTMFILFLQRWGASALEAAVEAMLAVLASCFVVELFMSQPDPKELLLGTVIPSLPNARATVSAISILGAVIMGHNLFLHSGLILSRCDQGSYQTRHKTRGILMYASTEAAIALFASFLINAAVMAVAGARLYEHRFEPGYEDVGLRDASILLADVLENYKDWAPKIWGVALLCSGHCATVTGTYASQLVVEGFLGFERDEMRNSWITNMFTRTAAIVPALIICLVAGEHVADRLVVGTQLVIAAQLPFAVIPLLRFVGSDEIMGLTFRTPKAMLVMGWVISFASMAASIYLISQSLQEIVLFLVEWLWSSQAFLSSPSSQGVAMVVLCIVGTTFVGGYFYLLWFLIRSPIVKPRHNADHHLFECPMFVPDPAEAERIGLLTEASKPSNSV